MTFFDDVSVGDRTTLTRGPVSTAHIMRWSAATENWHRIHYDHRYATEHDGLPDVVVNGSWKQHLLITLLTDWAGDGGWLWKVGFSFRGMNVPGQTLQAWGTVGELTPLEGEGHVLLDVGITDEDGRESTPGTAVVVLPRRGSSVAYPYTPSGAAAGAPTHR